MSALILRWPTAAALLLSPTLLFGQGASTEPPLAGRPADFSNIVGQYDIQVTATPLEVAVEAPITLRIQITGKGPPDFEPKRESLHLFPAFWDDQFYVEEMRDEHQSRRDEGSWIFVYQLRPKHLKIAAIDGIKLVYYDPAAAGKRKFVTRFVDAIPITVTPSSNKVRDIEVDNLAAPETFYHVFPLDGASMSFPPRQDFSVNTVVAYLLGVPLLSLLAALGWRKYFPAEQDRRGQRRLAAESARAKLRLGAPVVWDIVCRYLRERFNFLTEEPTPGEAYLHLLRLGFARQVCQQCRTLLESCDALRFGELSSGDSSKLAHDAEGLITAMENDRCAR